LLPNFESAGKSNNLFPLEAVAIHHFQQESDEYKIQIFPVYPVNPVK